MGYETYVDAGEMNLKDEITEEYFDEYKKNFIDNNFTSTNNNEQWYIAETVYDNITQIFDDGGLELYNPEVWFDFIAPLVDECKIYCNGEDNEDIWRVVFDGKGSWKIQQAEIIYEPIFTEFMNKYQKMMDEDTRKKLYDLKSVVELTDDIKKD